jgi:flavin-binding protein dodecin
VAVSAYNVVETLGSTETSRSHANNEDINVTTKMTNVSKTFFCMNEKCFLVYGGVKQ